MGYAALLAGKPELLEPDELIDIAKEIETPFVNDLPDATQYIVKRTKYCLMPLVSLVGQLQMSSVDRAIVSDSREGYIKLVSKKRPLVGYLGGGKIVGATIVCEITGELINEVAIAISKNFHLLDLEGAS